MENKEALLFFESIREFIPLDSSGKIDIQKLKEALFNGDKSNPIISYICSKIPEFFARGCSTFDAYYSFCSGSKEKSGETLLPKISQGDFSDIIEFEKMYPPLQYIAESYVFTNVSKTINAILLEEGHLITSRWASAYEKYKDIYVQIIRDNSFDYNGRKICEMDIPQLLKQDDVNRELLIFAAQVFELNNPQKIKPGCSIRHLDALRGIRAKKEGELAKAKRELEAIESELKKYNAFTSLFHKKDKDKKLNKRAELIKKIEQLEEFIQNYDKEIDKEEDAIEFNDNYYAKYIQIVQERLLPFLKKDIEENLTPEESQIVWTLISDYIKNNITIEAMRKTEEDLFQEMSYRLGRFMSNTFDESIPQFYNALTTILDMSNVVVDFEKADDKSLTSLLSIIRSQIMIIPTDADHQKLDNAYRTCDLPGSMGDFLNTASSHGDIPEDMRKLGEDYERLMQMSDIQEYVKEAGRIWYRFMQIHPYTDGNGRTGRYLLNTLLAHRGIIIPSLYSSLSERKSFFEKLDKNVIHVLNPDYDALAQDLFDCIRERAIDLTGQNRLGNVPTIDVESEMSVESEGQTSITR